MHARDTDPVEIALASGILLLGLPQDARLARLGGRDPQAVIARVREARAALHDPLTVGLVRRLVARAHVQIPTGLDDTDALIDAVCVAVARRTIIGVFLQRAPLGPPIAAPVQKPAPAAVPAFARMSAAQRIGLLLERTPKALAPDLAREFQSMTSPEARAAIVAGLAVLLVAQCAGIGEVVDAALAWWAYKQAGLTGLAGLYEALRAVVSAVRAESEGAFDQAVTRFAEGLTLVGVALLTVVVTRAAGKRAGGGESGSGDGASSFSRPKPEPAPQRWPIAPAAKREAAVAADEGGARAGAAPLTNPGFPAPGRVDNCVNCAIATDSTFAGRPASALPQFDPRGVPISEIPKALGLNTKFTKAGSIGDLEATFEQFGPGSRGVIFGDRGPGQVGHVFNVIVDQRGAVKFWDGQAMARPSLSGQGYKTFWWIRSDQ